MMKSNETPIWYGMSRVPYTGDEPAFFNAGNFEWAKYIEANYATIRAELSRLVDDNTGVVLKPYFEDKLQYPPANWKTESFCYWGKKNHRMCRIFPKTYGILKKVPGLVSASVNLLEPGSKILPHFGDTNGIFRCHLGLKVPGGLPECAFKVEQESRAWEEGKLLIFLDAYTHEAQNLTNEKRYILLFDVIRPEFTRRKYSICTHVLAMLTLYWLISKYPSMIKMAENWSDRTKESVLIPIQLAWYLYLPLQNALSGWFH